MRLKKLAAIALSITMASTSLTGCGVFRSARRAVTEKATKEVLKMVTDGNTPPYSYYENGKLTGIDIDVAKQIAKDSGKDLQIETVPADKVAEAVESGKADIGFVRDSDAATTSRALTTKSYVKDTQSIISKKSSNIYTKSDLKGKKIGVQKSTQSAVYAKKDYGESNVKEYKSNKALMRALEKGEIDAGITSKSTVASYAKTQPEYTYYDYRIYDPVIVVGNDNNVEKDVENTVNNMNQNNGIQLIVEYNTKDEYNVEEVPEDSEPIIIPIDSSEDTEEPAEYTTEVEEEPDDFTIEGEEEPTEYTTEGEEEPSDFTIEDTEEPTEYTTEDIEEPTEYTTEGTEEPTEYTTEGTEEPTEYTAEDTEEPTEYTTEATEEVTTEEEEEQQEIEVGDVVSYGHYEEDIEWIVLDKKDGKALLLSRYVLKYRTYNKEQEETSWEQSDVREWLNDSFYDTAFDDSEQDSIVKTKVTADNNSEYDTDAGDDTKDKVFLLSVEEAKEYLSEDMAICEPTEAALADADIEESESNWWLRTPGESESSAAYMTPEADIAIDGADVSKDVVGVRPAMWVEY